MHLMLAAGSATLPADFSAAFYENVQRELAGKNPSSYPTQTSGQVGRRHLAEAGRTDLLETSYIVRNIATSASFSAPYRGEADEHALERVSSAVGQLVSFRGLGPDWDYEGAPPPDRDAVDAAIHFLMGRPSGTWSAQLHADGSVILERDEPELPLIELTFVSGSQVEAYMRINNADRVESIGVEQLYGWLAAA